MSKITNDGLTRSYTQVTF